MEYKDILGTLAPCELNCFFPISRKSKKSLLMSLFSSFIVVSVFFFTFQLAIARDGEAGIRLEYTVKVIKDEIHHFYIRAEISGIETSDILLVLTQNYGKVKKREELIPEISVRGADNRVPLIRNFGEFLWDLGLPGQNQVIIEYKINTQYPYSTLNLVRLPYRDGDHLYFPGASVFIHPEEKFLMENKIQIKSIRIHFDLPSGWITATSWGLKKLTYDLDPPSLENLNAGLIGAGTYRTYSFEVDGLPVETAILNLTEEIQDQEVNLAMAQALKSGYNIFKFYPIDRHFSLVQFIFDHPGQGAANALGWSINLNCGRKLTRTDWLRQVAAIFHEIFHHWNGTQGQPISRDQDDHSLIWFTEGITRFYQNKNMLTSGLISEEEYLDALSQEFGTVYHSSLRDESLDKISRNYYADPKAMALTSSKGCSLAFALDLLIKHVSSNEKSFDDVLKLLLKRYDFRRSGHCYTHEELDNIFREVLGEECFPSYVRLYGKDFLHEFAAIIDRAGLTIEKKKGGRLFFGIIDFGPPSGPLSAFKIDRESPAYQAGLREGDILLEIDGLRVSDTPDIKRCLEKVKESDEVNLIIQRGEKKVKIRTPWMGYQTLLEIKRKPCNHNQR